MKHGQYTRYVLREVGAVLNWFDVDLSAGGGLMEMMGGFTVLRLSSMIGMANINFSKEELLKMNKQLNRIRKPKSKK